MAGINNPIPKLMMKLQRIRYGKGCVFHGIPVILQSGKGKVSIGDRVAINSSFLSNLVGLYQRSIIFARDGGVIEIGDDVGISGVTIYARKRIVIGNGTLIGGNTKILDNDFHPISAEERQLLNNGYGKNANDMIRKKEIYIGEDCFIGCNSIILKGTRLGNGCVVGAGAVVTGEYEDHCVIAGNPARVIKRLHEKVQSYGVNQI